MNIKFKSGIILALALTMVIFWSTMALAWDKQERYHNTTGQTAYDLYKVLRGNYTITRVIDTHFASYEVFHIGDQFTVIRFYNGVVPDTTWAWACFDAEQPPDEIDVWGAEWTDINGDPIGNAGPNLAQTASYEENTLQIDLTHHSRDFTGPASNPQVEDTLGTIYGTQVYYAIEDHVRPLEELTEDLYTDPTITWIALSDFTLNFEQTKSYIIPGPFSVEDDVVLLRFFLSCEGESAEDIFQFTIQEATFKIPTLTNWGLLALLLLLIAAATIAIRRTRRVNA